MIASWYAHKRFEAAAAASLVLHVLVALSIPALAWMPSNEAAVETISFVRVSHIELVPQHKPAPQPQAVAPVRQRVAQITFLSHHDLARTRPHRLASPLPVVAERIAAAPAVAQAVRAGTEQGGGTAAPEATATPAARAVASVGTNAQGGYLPFGAEQPDPVLDPRIRQQLASLGVHVTLVVVVGEDGHTKAVTFDPPLDPQLKSRIESLLADASWDPAVCGGGVACEGRATIKL